MKKHVRILYAVAVVVIVIAGVALMSQNDRLERETSPAATAPATTEGASP
jgi:hypothetical protein